MVSFGGLRLRTTQSFLCQHFALRATKRCDRHSKYWLAGWTTTETCFSVLRVVVFFRSSAARCSIVSHAVVGEREGDGTLVASNIVARRKALIGMDSVFLVMSC